MNARLFQQIRLWVYVILLVLLILSIWDRHADFVAFLMFAIVLFLPYLEVCPTCGKLAWWEGAAGQMFSGSEQPAARQRRRLR